MMMYDTQVLRRHMLLNTDRAALWLHHLDAMMGSRLADGVEVA
jgi:hypothetical protein